MLGYAVWHRNIHPRIEVQEIAGTPVALIQAGREGWISRHAMRRLSETMVRGGVREVAFAEAFPLSLRREIPLRTISSVSLRRAMLEPLFIRFCAQQGIVLPSVSVHLTAPTGNEALYQAACLLSRHARYVDVQAGRSGDALRQRLLRELGVAGCQSSAVPAVEVTFHPAPAGEIPALCLGRGCGCQSVSYQLSDAWQQKLTGFEAEEGLLSLLFAAGKLPTEEIQVKSVEPMLDTTAKKNYNAT